MTKSELIRLILEAKEKKDNEVVITIKVEEFIKIVSAFHFKECAGFNIWKLLKSAKIKLKEQR